jgi:AraC-like DNA-binding protein
MNALGVIGPGTAAAETELMPAAVVSTADAQEPLPSDPWFRTRSPEEAMDARAAAFYPHRLRLLGSSKGFALRQRVSHIGPITVGDTVYETDVAVEFENDRANYHVLIPLNGCLESRYRGQPLTSTPTLASIYRPDAEMAATWWPGGSRHLAVKIDQVAVDRALEALIQGSLSSPVEFDPSLPLIAGAAQEWVRLLLLVHRQLENPNSMVGHSLVLAPLVESLIHGFLLVTNHPYRESLATPAEPGRSAAVSDAMSLIEAGPHLPLTTSQLAMQCHVSVRSLQEGFRRHLGMSPMAYLREVRLRRAHSDLRAAHPSHTTVAAVAHRWGFTHLGRFATAHKLMYGETPHEALRAANSTEREPLAS